MPIGNVVQKGNTVTVYDENNRYLWSRGVGNGPKDGVTGYTASQVNIRNGNTITSYGADNRYISSRGC
jgi:hypothetical protein